MLSRKDLYLDRFEYFIYVLYNLFLKIKRYLYLILIAPFRTVYNFIKIIILMIRISVAEKSSKIFHDSLEIFYEQAYTEYRIGNKFLMNYYLFLYLFPQKRLERREELILHFEDVKEQKRKEYLNSLKNSYKIPCTPIYPYPRKLENFFSKYRFIKMIGFYNYFIKGERKKFLHY